LDRRQPVAFCDIAPRQLRLSDINHRYPQTDTAKRR
jgi:hypothetical protein